MSTPRLPAGQGGVTVGTEPRFVVERRHEARERQFWQPHPDQIRDCAGVAEFYGIDLGPMGEDAIRRVIVAALAWEERRAHEERQHARLRDGAEIVERVSRHLRRPAPLQYACATCEGRGGFVTFGADSDKHDGGAECPDCGGTGIV